MHIGGIERPASALNHGMAHFLMAHFSDAGRRYRGLQRGGLAWSIPPHHQSRTKKESVGHTSERGTAGALAQHESLVHKWSGDMECSQVFIVVERPSLISSVLHCTSKCGAHHKCPTESRLVLGPDCRHAASLLTDGTLCRASRSSKAVQ